MEYLIPSAVSDEGGTRSILFLHYSKKVSMKGFIRVFRRFCNRMAEALEAVYLSDRYSVSAPASLQQLFRRLFLHQDLNLLEWFYCICPVVGNFEIGVFMVFQSMVDLLSIANHFAIVFLEIFTSFPENSCFGL